MASLLPSISSDEEDNSKEKKIPNYNESDDEDDEVDGDFEFGGVLGEDGGLFRSSAQGWSYQTALDFLEVNDAQGLGQRVPRMDIANIIAAKRKDIKNAAAVAAKKTKIGADQDIDDVQADIDDDHDDDNTNNGDDASVSEDSGEGEASNSSDQSSESEIDDDEVDQDDEEQALDHDTLKLRAGNDDNEDEDEPDIVDDDREAEIEAAYFDTHKVTNTDSVEVFAQLNLSRPFLRGVAAMGFTKPTPVQAAVIPVALAGRDVCASAQTGSGKTAAFLLPVLERIYQRVSSAGIKCVILTPTRELAAQCLGMIVTLAQFSNLRASLVVGGVKNVQAQAAELRTCPDIVVATPGRLLDHVTNSAGVTLDHVEFLVLDECDRLLQLGFQEEVHEIVKACPSERQTMLFSATLNTKVDELVKLSLKRPVRFKVSGKDQNNSSEVEVAERLEQEFVRVRAGNEGINREGMLLSLLTRTYTSRTIVFFDTKAQAHRMMILCGLCGIKCAELHGNLTQMQRLTALEEFRNGDVDILLATDLAARGLDIDRVHSVVNFEMPSQVETYVHRIGRTARRGRAGKSCTLIGEGRRHLMKDVIRDAEEKVKRLGKASQGTTQSGIIRSRTIPQGVIAHFAAKIKSLESHVEEVYQAEAIAKMDRQADMEALKAQNLIEHADEIKARPQREWFASKQQKTMTKEAMAEKARLIAEKVGTGTHRMTRKKRRARDAKEELLRAQTEAKEEAQEKGHKAKTIVTDKVMKTTARAAKRESQRQRLSERETSVDDDDRKMMNAQKAKMKRKGAFASDSLGDSSLFQEERSTHAKKSKGAEVSLPSTYNFRGFDPSKDGIKVKKRGVHKFKSKSKFKRRK